MKKNFVCTACGIVITVSLLLTGCKGNAAKTTNPSDALLATETTAATEATKATTKATTPKPTTKPATKPSTSKPTTGKTDSTKATEATKPAASEPTSTQKPSESPKPTEVPKATETPKPTNPPATEAPKPTETEPLETEPEDPYPYSASDAMSYGNSYAASLGFNIDYSLNKYDDAYIMTHSIAVSTLEDLGGQSWLNESVIDQVNSTMDTITASYGITDWTLARGLVLVEETTLYGEPAYRIYFLYG